MIKRTLYSLLCIMVLFGVVSNFAYAEEVTQTINLNFPQKNEITQSQTIHVPNLLEVTNIDVDNVIVTATNGTPVQVQTGGEYIPAETKYVEGQTNANYNQNGYVGTLEKYLYSGSYTPSDTKYVEGQTAASYNQGGYSGTLTQYVYSGSYTPAHTKYESGEKRASGWCANGEACKTKAESGMYSSYSYNQDGYTGTLNEIDYVYDSWADNGGFSWTRYQKYGGNVTKPASDTRVYRYKGNVTKPAVDTRVYRYRGNVTKPAVDTRTYESVYTYNVTLKYKVWQVPPNQIELDGLTFNGTSQYFSIQNLQSYNVSKNVTWGIMIRPKSLIDQTIVSNGDIEFKIDNHKVQGWLKINGEQVVLGFEASNLHLNKWTHLALSYDGEQAKFYYNNQLVDSKTIIGSLQYEKNLNIAIGKNPATDTSYFNGDVSQFSIWDKELSQDEINLASNGNYQNSGLGEWTFSTLTNALSYDQSSNKNHAKGYNFSPLNELTVEDISDLGMKIKWNALNEATGYELKRGEEIVYDGEELNYREEALQSETAYEYAITAKNRNGKSVPAKASFTTNPGSLEILSVPSAISFNPITLNGKMQRSYVSSMDKIIVKDTRKNRDGWRLTVQASNVKSSSSDKSFPNKSLKLQPLLSVTQTKGKIADSPNINTLTQFIDEPGEHILVNASSSTGQGIYEINLPNNALELTIDPSTYANEYETDLNWILLPGY
ncbi:LamG-like jellyroll fold domain-containing protein [Bacillaceae bacterium CLA-AA-H227]